MLPQVVHHKSFDVEPKRCPMFTRESIIFINAVHVTKQRTNDSKECSNWLTFKG